MTYISAHVLVIQAISVQVKMQLIRGAHWKDSVTCNLRKPGFLEEEKSAIALLSARFSVLFALALHVQQKEMRVTCLRLYSSAVNTTAGRTVSYT